MGKRRTRKQKEKAKHKFTYSWGTGSKNKSSEAVVKGQFKNKTKARFSPGLTPKKAKKLAKAQRLPDVRRDIVKSLILASLVLSLEVMIYLAWNQ